VIGCSVVLFVILNEIKNEWSEVVVLFVFHSVTSSPQRLVTFVLNEEAVWDISSSHLSPLEIEDR
jgi:hypothetical protein